MAESNSGINNCKHSLCYLPQPLLFNFALAHTYYDSSPLTMTMVHPQFFYCIMLLCT